MIYQITSSFSHEVSHHFFFSYFDLVVQNISSISIQLSQIQRTISIGNSSVWLNFNLNIKNKIDHHIQKEHLKISKMQSLAAKC